MVGLHVMLVMGNFQLVLSKRNGIGDTKYKFQCYTLDHNLIIHIKSQFFVYPDKVPRQARNCPPGERVTPTKQILEP
jgi:hypothetical protein